MVQLQEDCMKSYPPMVQNYEKILQIRGDCRNFVAKITKNYGKR